jgi:2-hydroxycyclohexanecarboxyl-CoA dehydrogenase
VTDDGTGTTSGKTALVVGAGSGIGRATALLLASKGIDTRIADINVDAARSVGDASGNIKVVGDRAWDATSAEECSRLVETTASEAGQLDILVSTVGWTAVTPFLDETPDYWQRVIDLNLMSAIYLSQAAAKAMKETGGTIVLTSSEAGKVGTSGESVYAAAKAGVIGLVKSLAREFARYGIRINAIAPGITDTPLLASQTGAGVLDSIVKAVPLRRVGTPEEIAAGIAFMAFDDSSYVTGQTLCVGGGLTMTS